VSWLDMLLMLYTWLTLAVAGTVLTVQHDQLTEVFDKNLNKEVIRNSQAIRNNDQRVLLIPAYEVRQPSQHEPRYQIRRKKIPRIRGYPRRSRKIISQDLKKTSHRRISLRHRLSTTGPPPFQDPFNQAKLSRLLSFMSSMGTDEPLFQNLHQSHIRGPNPMFDPGGTLVDRNVHKRLSKLRKEEGLGA